MIKTNIKQLPLSERPYEKCLKYGASSLSDAELLAVIIRTGTKKENSIQLASRVINEIPGKKISGLFQMSVAQLYMA
jgi:DNA repair protein RadC